MSENPTSSLVSPQPENPEDIDKHVASHPAHTKQVEMTYSARDLIKALVDADDLDATVCIRFLNCDPIAVSDVEFDEGQITLEGST